MDEPIRADLPPALRAEVERAQDVHRRRHEEHRAWLRRYRLLHVAGGAVAITLAMQVLAWSWTWRSALDAVLGAAAALGLSLLGGGAYRGLGIFGAAGAVSLVVRIVAAGFSGPFVSLAVFLALPSMALALAVGYLAGWRLDEVRFERSVTAS